MANISGKLNLNIFKMGGTYSDDAYQHVNCASTWNGWDIRWTKWNNTQLFTLHSSILTPFIHDDFIKWKKNPRYWPFVRGIHRSPVNYPHKDQWRGKVQNKMMFCLICTRINVWVNNREAGDLRRHLAHRDITVVQREATYKSGWFMLHIWMFEVTYLDDLCFIYAR